MFLAENSDNNTEKQLKGLSGSLGVLNFNVKDFFENFNKNIPLTTGAIKNITDATSKLEDLTFKATTESLGQTRILGEGVRDTIAQATMESAQYGITLDDQLSVFKEINSVMQKNTLLTAEQQTNIALLARNAGVGAGEIATMVEAFDNVGVSTNDAIENISEMQKQARTYGLNVGQFMKNIGSNIKLLSSYNFKNGVEGFTKMVAKAQSLRINFNSVVKLADDMMDPERAIETAAGFQMLGGAVGDLGDPFKLLHMAQNDVGGLQDSILEMAESAVVFNEKTGEFDVPVTEMYRLREAAKLTGMDYQELTQTAIKSAEKTRKLDMLGPMSRYTDEQKDLIANMAELQDGKLQIKLPGEEGLIDAANLNEEQLAKLAEQQENANKSDREIALEQLSASQKLNEILDNQVKALGPFIGTRTDAITSTIDTMGAGAQTMIENINKSFSAENVGRFGETFTNALIEGFKDTDKNEMFKTSVGNLLHTISSGFDTLSTDMSKNFSESNVFNNEGAFNNLAESLTKLGFSAESLGAIGAGDIFSTLSSEMDAFTQDLLTISQRTGQHTNQRENNKSVTNINDILNNNDTNTTPSNINGDLGLNVNGTINLKIDGSNLPSNISTEQLANTIVNNPDFIAQLQSVLSNSNNTYSG